MPPLLPRGCVRPIQWASARRCPPVARPVRRHLPPSPNPPSATARHRTGWQRLAARAQTTRGYAHAGFRDGQLALKVFRFEAMGPRALLRRLPSARRMAGWLHDNSQSVSFELTHDWYATRAVDAIRANAVADIISDNVSFLERDPWIPVRCGHRNSSGGVGGPAILGRRRPISRRGASLVAR